MSNPTGVHRRWRRRALTVIGLAVTTTLAVAIPALAHPTFSNNGPGFPNPTGGTGGPGQTPPYPAGSTPTLNMFLPFEQDGVIFNGAVNTTVDVTVTLPVDFTNPTCAAASTSTGNQQIGTPAPNWTCTLETASGHQVLHWHGPQVSLTQTEADSAQYFTFQATMPSPATPTSYGAVGGPEGIHVTQIYADNTTEHWTPPNDPSTGQVANGLVRTVAGTSTPTPSPTPTTTPTPTPSPTPAPTATPTASPTATPTPTTTPTPTPTATPNPTPTPAPTPTTTPTPTPTPSPTPTSTPSPTPSPTPPPSPTPTPSPPPSPTVTPTPAPAPGAKGTTTTLFQPVARVPHIACQILGALFDTKVPDGDCSVLMAKVAPPTATGTVQFTDKFMGTTSAVDDPVPVRLGGLAVVLTTKLAKGTHQLTAIFTPQNPTAFNPSTSATGPIVINGK
jgi:hypothetical protein